MTPGCRRQVGRILSNETVARACKEIHISWDGSGPLPRPGQFLAILPPRYPYPLLRRPFAYSGAGKSSFAFVYEVVGTATEDLAALEPGDEVDWIGPLGKVFPKPPPGVRPILAAGGAGIGPIFYLSTVLAAHGFKPLVFAGAQTAELLPGLAWPPEVETRICTEDGSAGIAGTVLDGIRQTNSSSGVFYSCGPLPMMEAVHRLAVETQRPSWVSMEEVMACGVGACQGCAVPVVNNESQPAYKRVCDEGPVFESRELAWPSPPSI